MTVKRKFRVGDLVRWSSQSGGRVKAKEGRVVWVVEAGVTGRDAIEQFAKAMGLALGQGRVPEGYINMADFGLLPRNGTSYIVAVDGEGRGKGLRKARARKKRLYYPYAGYLELILEW